MAQIVWMLDLNLTLSSGEIWGERARLDPLSDFFSSMFASTGFVDISPSLICPTWRNGCSGIEGISKRLDLFLMNEDLLGNLNRCRSWVINSFLTDHNPVCLQFEEHKDLNHFPFEFNHAWLLELDFNLLVRSTWKSMILWKDISAMNLIVTKLKKLKEAVASWQKEKRKKIQAEYRDLEQNLTDVFQRYPSQIFTPEDKELIMSLEKRKVEILKSEEESWRLKSRAVCLKSEDRNTKFFHKFAEHRKKYNIIWDILDNEGDLHHSQAEIGATTFNFYKSLYKAKDTEDDTLTQLNVLKEVPRFFSDEESNEVGKQAPFRRLRIL